MPDEQAPHSPPWWRPWIILAFWLGVIGALYLVMERLLQPPAAVYHAEGAGELHLPRHRDGHFYAAGSINGVPVVFLVDTGASIVSVSDAVADAAGLQGGRPTVFQTANGPRTGHVATVGNLQLGGFSLRDIRVGTGLNAGSSNKALLGQNVLAHFNVSIEGGTMVLRPR